MELMGSEEADRRGYRRLYGGLHEETCWRIVEEWEPRRDTLSLRRGYLVGMGLSALTPLPLFSAITQHFPLKRTKVGLGYTFRVLPVFLPSLTSGALGMYNTSNIILDTFPCSVCQEIRSISSQLLSGFVLPLVFTLASKGYFLSMKSIHVPNPLSKEFFYWSKNIFQRCHRSLSVIALCQIGIMSLLTSHQLSSWHAIKTELNQRMDQDQETTYPKI